jgi:uncharacterized protein (DUF1330 family)
MSAYFLVNVDVTNPQGYEEYRKMAGATVQQYGGKFLVRGGDAKSLEGTTVPKRVVLLQFDSVEQARTWYTSPEYTEAIKVRQANSVTEMFILAEGA